MALPTIYPDRSQRRWIIRALIAEQDQTGAVGLLEISVQVERVSRVYALLCLDRFAPELVFEPIVGMYDVEKHKPDPDGLLRIVGQTVSPANSVFYIGDTVDDARAARAARVPFIGIAAPVKTPMAGPPQAP